MKNGIVTEDDSTRRGPKSGETKRRCG